MLGKRSLTWRIACPIKLAWDFPCLVNHVGGPSPLWGAPCLGRCIKGSWTWTWRQARKQWSSMTSSLSCCLGFPWWWWSKAFLLQVAFGQFFFFNYRDRKHCRMQDGRLEEVSVDWQVPSSHSLHPGSGALSSDDSRKLYSSKLRNTLRCRVLRRAFVT